MGVAMTTGRGRREYLQELPQRSKSWRGCRCFISAAASLTRRGRRGIHGPVLHLKVHFSLGYTSVTFSSGLVQFPSRPRGGSLGPCCQRPGPGIPAYLPHAGLPGSWSEPLPSMVHCPRPQRGAGIEIHWVGLLPGNVPQGHRRLGKEDWTITSVGTEC